MTKPKASSQKISPRQHKVLILEAAEICESLLPYFEQTHPTDKRPHKAIALLKLWLEGQVSLKRIKEASLEVTTAANSCKAQQTRAVALCVAHALSVVQNPENFKRVEDYAQKVVKTLRGPSGKEKSPKKSPKKKNIF